MKKIELQKKYLMLFSLAFFVLIIFSLFPANKVLSAGLEVDYPQLITGAEVTPQSDLTQYLKYIFDLGLFIGFFAVFGSLIWAGVLYFLSPVPTINTIAEAKDRVSGAISGLLILALLYLIITTINPYLAIFTLTPLKKLPPPPATPPQPGVSFYSSKDCSGTSSINTSGIPDFGDLKNKINSVGVVDDANASYISILYDTTNYWGKCQYITSKFPCKPVDPFGASASIYQYDNSPSGDGVYFYRKSGFNKEGGWLKITNSQIGKVYIGDLTQLQFNNSSCSEGPDNCCVPEDEQDCIKYNENGKCIQKKCPSLAGKNISSIKISGNYIVLLVYRSYTDNSAGPWTYCQLFPIKDDINKDGPIQIKWEAIRNIGQNPNYVVIIPVMQK